MENMQPGVNTVVKPAECAKRWPSERIKFSNNDGPVVCAKRLSKYHVFFICTDDYPMLPTQLFPSVLLQARKQNGARCARGT